MAIKQVDIGYIDPKVIEAAALEACREAVDKFKALHPSLGLMNLLRSHFVEPPLTTPYAEALHHAAMVVFKAARDLPAETRRQQMRDLLGEVESR